MTVSFCVATGSYDNDSTSLTLVQQWDGTSWTVIPSPNIGTNGNNLNSVSCVTESFCVATGYQDNDSTNQTLVEQWDGENWTVIPSPNPGTNGNNLNAVSCVTESFCVATGWYFNAPETQALVISLTGPLPPTTTTTMPSDPVAPAFTG